MVKPPLIAEVPLLFRVMVSRVAEPVMDSPPLALSALPLAPVIVPPEIVVTPVTTVGNPESEFAERVPLETVSVPAIVVPGSVVRVPPLTTTLFRVDDD